MPPDAAGDRIRRALVAVAPPGWSRVDVTVWSSVVLTQFRVGVRTADGGMPTLDVPAEVVAAFQELRADAYRPGRGTWFSAHLVLTPPDQVRISYNLDEDPKWWPPVPPTVFASDLAAFPRDDAHVPGWLRAELDKAAEIDEHFADQPLLGPVSDQPPT